MPSVIFFNWHINCVNSDKTVDPFNSSLPSLEASQSGRVTCLFAVTKELDATKLLQSGREQRYELEEEALTARLRCMLSVTPLQLDLHAQEDQKEQSSKTEEATETRKRKAREEGEVYLTQELPQALLIIIVISTLALLSTYYYKTLAEHLAGFLENRNQLLPTVNSLAGTLNKSVGVFVKLFAPAAAVAFVTVILSTMLQTKFMISVKPLRFNPQKLLPSIKNFLERTIFSRTQVINTFKTFIKFIVSTIILVVFFYQRFGDFIDLFSLDIYDAFVNMLLYTYEALMYLGAFLLVLAIPDWLVQRFEYSRRLRMTQEEVRRESKELEGDPLIRQRQRQRARQLATGNMLSKVATADVVITNPTHFACAIVYELDNMDAPKLVAKGVDVLALKIRELARKHDVALIENKPLARALYYKVNIDEYIPKEFYTVVAEVLAALDKFKK